VRRALDATVVDVDQRDFCRFVVGGTFSWQTRAANRAELAERGRGTAGRTRDSLTAQTAGESILCKRTEQYESGRDNERDCHDDVPEELDPRAARLQQQIAKYVNDRSAKSDPDRQQQVDGPLRDGCVPDAPAHEAHDQAEDERAQNEHAE
jgi:hypothetical protein